MNSREQETVRVLIAEDDYLVGETIKGLLEDVGYAVVGEAADGLEAVEMTQSLRPDVVLMDIKMPDVDGLEATRLIHERCPTPVVVLTAHEVPELVEEASEAGVGAYLLKPPNVREVERAITIAVARFGDMMKLRDYAGQLEQRVQERTAQLQAQYARLDAILRSTADGIVVTDGAGNITQANPVAQTWLTKTLSPEDATQMREAVRELAQRAGERPETVLELTGLDLELSAGPVAGEGELAAVVDIHDVSHLKALDRMKTHFIANISHELRTPVATIKLYAYLMRLHPEKWEQYLDTLAQEADHQAHLVEGILQISRIDAGRLEMSPCPTPLNELTQAAVANRRVLAQERGLTLEHRPPPPSPPPHPSATLRAGAGGAGGGGPVALVDPEQMMHVLDNLVGNGIRYTSDGGTVVVSTGTEQADGRMWATATVADTGMGIPEDELPHIFDRFFRGKRPREMQLTGTGLGLSIVREIVELHGGRVTVESPSTLRRGSGQSALKAGEEGAGSTFTVWLPLAD